MWFKVFTTVLRQVSQYDTVQLDTYQPNYTVLSPRKPVTWKVKFFLHTP